MEATSTMRSLAWEVIVEKVLSGASVAAADLIDPIKTIGLFQAQGGAGSVSFKGGAAALVIPQNGVIEIKGANQLRTAVFTGTIYCALGRQ